ncbi:DNA invertase Pin-like site-specific DNA recombinase [Ruminiclostridium sufflavum DSM 19573]|uniref:DNA invertase Pin-like site-specific DNA recombinase n=1 Tax=Ruminiclostridium sufflavum DSM 19573 TaxID=1121337 RepID=A0A318Y5V0_9FIRM|nr:recombinase family protein [Ruminiclostridium sufflavum]PYG87370.1 DNA invertase Pin-like site-specific DNA recombinase [Ruminiclostridium sufflavum DSM 19573]
MIRIYARQSLDKKDSLSISSQIEFCKREIKDGEEYRVYTDKGYSGSSINRPAFEKLLEEVQNNRVSRVIVYRLDRISRSLLDFAKIIELFQRHKVEFISSTEKFDTSTPMGRAMLGIIMIFAELERDTIRKRIKDNYYARGKKGFFMGGPPPFGFDKISARVDGIKTSALVPSIIQYEAVRKIYDLYANTQASLGEISSQLNESNVKAPRGGLWDSCKISRILRNPVYVRADAEVYIYYKNKGCIISNDINDFVNELACFLYGKRDSNERKYTDVKEHVLSLALHEGMVTSQVFLKCQYKLDSNKQLKNTGRGKHTWLSGLTKCGYCQYTMTVVKNGSTSYGTYKYFICRGKTNYKCCDGHTKAIYVDAVEKIVRNEIFDKVRSIKDTPAEAVQAENAEANRLKIRIFEIDTQIDNLVNSLAKAGTVLTDYINKKIAGMDSEKKELINRLKECTERVQPDNTPDSLNKCINNWEKSTLEQKKTVAKFLIEKISIKDDEVAIKWKI